MKVFKPVKQNRISEEVLNQLKGAILSGRYRPGEKIPPERELTEQFQVSRVVIREAIRELELTGFVRILQGPTGGAFVTDLSFEHLSSAFLDLFLADKLSAAEVFEVRLHIEPEIARLAALNADEESLGLLYEALESEIAPASSHEKVVSSRFEVDGLLAEMCGNRLYQAIANSLMALAREIILEVKPVETIIFRHEEHVEMVRAVEGRDPEAAAEAVRNHIRNVGRSLVKLEDIYRKKKGLAESSYTPSLKEQS